jgi:hypothetical protein
MQYYIPAFCLAVKSSVWIDNAFGSMSSSAVSLQLLLLQGFRFPGERYRLELGSSRHWMKETARIKREG